MVKIFKEIDLFIKSVERNKCINKDGINLYIRKSKRLINNVLYDFLDIASIEVKIKNKGNFTYFINIFQHKYPNIYVENIMNPIVCHILEKFNFKYKSAKTDMFLMCDMYFMKSLTE